MTSNISNIFYFIHLSSFSLGSSLSSFGHMLQTVAFMSLHLRFHVSTSICLSKPAHIKDENLSQHLLNPHLLTCLEGSLDHNMLNSPLLCFRDYKYEWQKRDSYGVKAGGCGADAAGQQEVPWWDTVPPSSCWPAACYLLQRWLTSRRGVCKVGQHIICLPPLFLSSVTSSSRSPWLYKTSNSPHNLPSFVSPVVPLSRPRLFSLLCFPKLVFSFFARMYFLLSMTRSALSHLSPDHWRIWVVFRTQPDWESEGMRGKEGRNGWR